ncbi:Short-chain-enoyl-CoA hydratase [subsurface metagenome]
MEYRTILYEKENGIGVVCINRPQVLNVQNSEMFSELYQVFNEISTDNEVRVVIITGTGDKAFVAGTDITEMKSRSSLEIRDFAIAARKANEAIYNLGKPVIAAINGFALGGGLELAMVCDLRICSENAKFGQPEINLGIIPGGGGTQRLTRLVGMTKAKELLFTGDTIDAQTAVDIGLVNKVVPNGKLMDEAKALAQKLLDKGAVALRLAKTAINTGANMVLSSALDFEADCFATCFSTEDQKEGMSAFLEKRKPQFKGR